MKKKIRAELEVLGLGASDHPRLQREGLSIALMIRMYCGKQHGRSGDTLCPACTELKEFCFLRLQCCPFGEEKPTCKNCQVHCYKGKKDLRAEVRAVMRYAGPRMLLLHPVLAIAHSLDSHFRQAQPLPKPKRK